MKKLEIAQLENIQGEGFLTGLCAGLTASAGIAGLAELAATYGMIAAIPGVGQAAVVSAGLMIGACTAAYLFR